MKSKIILSLFVLTISVNAQYSIPQRKRVPEWVKIVGIQVGSIALDAVGDALCDNGEKVWGHGFQAASTGLLLTSPLILDIDKSKWLPYFAGYLCFRITLFDPVYNGTRGLPIDYIGTTSMWDKAVQKFKPPKHAQLFARSLFFTAGIGITINEFKPKPYGTHSISYVTDHKESLHPVIWPMVIMAGTFVINEVFVDDVRQGAAVYMIGCGFSIGSFIIGEKKRKKREWNKN